MKKIIVYLLFVLFLSIFISAQEFTISDQIEEIIANPKSYTLVIGRTAKVDEVKIASDLLNSFGLTKTNFDSQITTNTNLVIVGLWGNNQKITEFIKEQPSPGAFIAVRNGNLIITGQTVGDLQKGIDLLRNHERYQEKLSLSTFTTQDFFAPIKEALTSMLFIYIVVTVLLAGSSTALIIHHKRKAKHVNMQQQTQINPQLKNYIVQNLQKGYQEQQIRDALIKAGWNSSLLDATFSEIHNFQRE